MSNMSHRQTGLRPRWILLLTACVLNACQSTPQIVAEQAPVPLPNTLGACEKAAAMWNGKILPSRHAELPPLSGVGFMDVLAITQRTFSIKAFINPGDELEAGRRKRIHAFGAEARLRLEILPAARGRYSGVFQSGAECAIGRFSLANKPTENASIPALAIKFFVDGNRPSLNLHLMNSVDGQAGHDFFATDFSNILPPAQSFSTKLLDRAFRAVAEDLGAKDTNPGRLTLEHLSAIHPDGTPAGRPATPYRIILKPTAAARLLTSDARANDDFRLRLAALPVGEAIYEIYTLDADESPDNARRLGQLVLTSPVVSSRYGDETLYFQHHTERK